jgi:hypothetical protein
MQRVNHSTACGGSTGTQKSVDFSLKNIDECIGDLPTFEPRSALPESNRNCLNPREN